MYVAVQSMHNNIIIIQSCSNVCIILTYYYCSNEQSEEHPQEIMWCRDEFIENLNEIEALNDIEGI